MADDPPVQDASPRPLTGLNPPDEPADRARAALPADGR
jgi:hypothetical protein